MCPLMSIPSAVAVAAAMRIARASKGFTFFSPCVFVSPCFSNNTGRLRYDNYARKCGYCVFRTTIASIVGYVIAMDRL